MAIFTQMMAEDTHTKMNYDVRHVLQDTGYSATNDEWLHLVGKTVQWARDTIIKSSGPDSLVPGSYATIHVRNKYALTSVHMRTQYNR